MSGVLDIEVSCFKDYRTANDPKAVNLLQWLTSKKYANVVDEIRVIDDKKERDTLKAKLPAITPSGMFSYRSESHLITHSGLMQFDIDLVEANKSIRNWEDLAKELRKLKNVAYCGRSVSGKGYWGLIPIKYTDKHKEHFEALYQLFSSFGIVLDDKPKNVASLRGYSYDENGYFNHNATPFEGLPAKKQVSCIKRTPIGKQLEGDNLLQWIVDKMNNAIEGERHGTRIKMARLTGGYIASRLLDTMAEQILIDAYLDQYGYIDSKPIQLKEIKAIKDGIQYGLSSPIFKPVENDQSTVLPLMPPQVKEPQNLIKPKHENNDSGKYPYEAPEIIPFDAYVSSLHFEDGILMADGFPASWDSTGTTPYIDKRTSDFIKMALINPALLGLTKDLVL